MLAGEFGRRRYRIRSGRDLPGHARRRMADAGSARSRLDPSRARKRRTRFDRFVPRIVRLTVKFGLKAGEQAGGTENTRRGYVETAAIDRAAGRFSFAKHIGGRRIFHLSFRDFWSEIDGILYSADWCVQSDEWARLPEAAADAKERYLWIMAEYVDHTVQFRAAACDRSAVPEAPWMEMMRKIRTALDSHLVFEVFDASAFLNARREGDVKYIRACFDDYDRTYSYQTEDEEIQAGDRVVVPCGAKNTERIATVVEVRYYSVDRVPYPLEKTKRVLRRADA